MKRKSAYYMSIISLLFLLIFNIVSITNKVYGDAGTGGSCIDGHSKTTLLDGEPATCVTDGWNKWNCEVCSEEWIETISATGIHDYKTVTKSATCTENGEKYEKCQWCDSIRNVEIIEAKGHNKTVYEEVEPTCTTAGYQKFLCMKCTYTYPNAEKINPLGHKYENDVITQPTCTEEGYTTSTCTRTGCSYSVRHTYKDPIGHKEEILAAVASTCTTTGLTEGKKCSVCNENTVEQQETLALGHSFGNWIIDKEATYDEEGHKYRICTNCNTEKEEQTIQKLTRPEISTSYTLKEIDNNKYLMLDKTSILEEFKKKITSNSNITIKDKKGNLLNQKSKVLTGANVITDEDNKVQYIVVLKGDIDCNGEITWNDIISANAIRINGKETDKARFLATDIDENNKIDFQDIIRLNAIRINPKK